MSTELQDVVDAIQDLTKVVLATQGKFETRADVVRRLAELAIPPTRIATILSIQPKAVHSVLTKERKRLAKSATVSKEITDGEIA